MNEKLLNKFLSGRLILTVTAALVFAYCSVVKTIPEEAVVAIVMYVVQAYFNRKRDNDDQK